MKKYQEERFFALRCFSYFRDIGCYKLCDNFMHNEMVHRRLYG